jgi:hypothetical protein
MDSLTATITLIDQFLLQKDAILDTLREQLATNAQAAQSEQLALAKRTEIFIQDTEREIRKTLAPPPN